MGERVHQSRYSRFRRVGSVFHGRFWRRRWLSLSVFLAAAFGRAPIAFAQAESRFHPGDVVVAIASAPIVADDAGEVDHTFPGLVFDVLSVRESRILVFADATGWLDVGHVVPLDRAAVERLSELIRANPNDAVLFLGRAYVESRLGDFESALADCNESIRLDPLAGGYMGRGIVRVEQGKFDEAIADFSEELRQDPGHAPALVWRGYIRQLRREFDAAIFDYGAALQFDPNSLRAYINRATAWEATEALAKAIDDYDQALRLDPGNLIARLNRAFLYRRREQYHNAREDYSAVLRTQPDNIDALCGRGWCYSATNNFDLALRDFERVLQINPQSAEALHGRGATRNGQGKYDLAIADLSQSALIDTDEADVYLQLGYAWHCKKDLPTAIGHYSNAIKVDSKYAEAYSFRSEAECESKRYSAAIDDAIRAQKLDSSFKPVPKLRTYAAMRLLLAFALPGLAGGIAGVGAGALTRRWWAGFLIAWIFTPFATLAALNLLKRHLVDCLIVLGQLEPAARDRDADLGMLPLAGLIIGLIAGVVAALITRWKFTLPSKSDDPFHGIAGPLTPQGGRKSE